MTDKQRSFPHLGLARALYGFVTLTFLALTLLVWVLFSARSTELLDLALDTAVRLRTEAAAHGIARTLHADWLDLEQLAATVGTLPEDQIAAHVAGLRGDGAHIPWVGLADTSGIVRVASDGVLEGQDVSAQPWFRNGLQGGFAGDIHEAVMLASVLPASPDGAPLRFVDLALPVRSAAGDVTGVLGMQIDVAWVQRLVDETAKVLNLDLFLVAADGTLALATAETDPGTAGLAVLQAARVGVASSGRETWPDGADYFSSLVPTVAYADLPSFGWRIVGRLAAESFQPTLVGALGATIKIAIAAIALLAAMTAIFVHLFIRPVGTLAHVAERIADGDEEFPPEQGNTHETAQLSAALARLQQGRSDVSGSGR